MIKKLSNTFIFNIYLQLYIVCLHLFTYIYIIVHIIIYTGWCPRWCPRRWWCVVQGGRGVWVVSWVCSVAVVCHSGRARGVGGVLGGARWHICSRPPKRVHARLLSAAALSPVNRNCKESLLDAIALIINYLGVPLGMAF